jgi:streptomycin 6-kinase
MAKSDSGTGPESAGFGIDEGVRQRLTARFGAEVATWLDELPATLAAVAQRWQCELGAAFERGSVAAVFRCRLLSDGRAAVLKASPDRARLALEAARLNAWHSVRTPSVIAFDEPAGALLLEAIEPGTPLAVSSSYPGAERVAELLAVLHGGDPTAASFPTVAQRVANLFESSATLYTRCPELTDLIPPGLYERGRRLATSLAQHGTDLALLHGDLTPGNILDGGADQGFVAIDPAPCVGDAAFDSVDLILWQAVDIETIEARCRQLAAVTGTVAGRYLDWCVAFAAMAALECASNGGSRSARFQTLVALAATA